MKKRFAFLVGLGALILTIVGSAFGAMAPMYGPEVFSVIKGKPITEYRMFAATAGEATLTLVNGTGLGENQVSTGWVTLNGIEVFTPADFNQQIDSLTRIVILRPENNLDVQVGGKAGSFIKLTISSDSIVPVPKPTAALEASPSEISAGANATLNWITSEATQALIEPGLGEVPLIGSMQVSPEQTTVYRLTATGPGGEATTEAKVVVIAPPPPPAYGIIFDPYQGRELEGSTINSLYLLVSGTVTVANTAEIGVSVNGVVAQVSTGRFAAKVPLQEGSNTIAVIATDAGGTNYQTSARVFSLPSTDYVNLTADAVAGIVPLNVEFTASAEINNSVVSHNFRCTGPTTFTPATSGVDTFQASFNLPGLYICRLAMVDQSGTTFDDSVIVNAYQNTVLNAQLQQKWTAMTAAMAQGDVSAMMPYFAPETRGIYAQQFGAIAANLPQMAADMRDISLLRVDGDRAICDLRLMKDGALYSFQVEFVLDGDGQWRIRAF